MYLSSSKSLPSIGPWDQLNRETVAGKGNIAKLNKFTELEVTKLTTSTVNKTALAILKKQESRGITIVNSQNKFIFDISILSILTELTDKIIETGNEGHSYGLLSARHLESLPHIWICVVLYSMEGDIKPRATAVLKCITERVGATICQ